jgi:hypothetical protein
MNDKASITLIAVSSAVVAICLTAMLLGTLRYCYEKQRMYAEHGYTQTTLPGHTQVYWVNPTVATNSIPKPVR